MGDGGVALCYQEEGSGSNDDCIPAGALVIGQIAGYAGRSRVLSVFWMKRFIASVFFGG